jgi:ribosome-binding protein aMBF1 (putative translation factor)
MVIIARSSSVTNESALPRSTVDPPSSIVASEWRRPIARSERRNVIELFGQNGAAENGAIKNKAAPAKTNPIDVHVGGRLRMKRRACGLSQQNLAEAASVSVAHLQRLETGALRIDAQLFRDLATILNTPPSFFFNGSIEAPATPSD